ncbi:metallophosphoesterase [Desulfuromonas sp. TF]|uniref:metallophosphoesterase family protein n=1 Tax=Desulfuromonas sp. TF TaxID=1232410 RepID=UPI0004152325|nr:metallophosphoesterase family protein [Desulfuromonas sp. TF]
MPSRILIISDTHGLIRPEIAEAAPGFDFVLHAGDIGSRECLEGLRAVNPNLVSVAGNVDWYLIAGGFPEQVEWRHEGYTFKIVHDLQTLKGDSLSGWDFVIFGHSHKPAEYRSGKTHFINPGSAGPRRFRLPISYATLELDAQGGHALRFHEIPPRKS